MSELRQNPLTGNWVVISPERGRKPSRLKEDPSPVDPRSRPAYDADCPFCPGNEKAGGLDILHEVRDHGRWLARVVENKYKIFDHHESCPAVLTPFERLGPYVRYQGCGEHYLVLEHEEHNRVMGMMETDSLRAVFTAYLEMCGRLRNHPNNLIAIIFKNQGRKAGGSQPHAHSQIVGSRVVPPWIRNALHVQERYFDTEGGCAMCEMLRYERREKARVVAETDTVVALSPYAAGSPYEVWVVPKRHFACYTDIDLRTLHGLTEMVGRVLHAYVKKLGNPDFNYFIHSSPYPLAGVPYYHLYVQIVPRLKEIGGFEMGTRIPVNPIAPEDAVITLTTQK